MKKCKCGNPKTARDECKECAAKRQRQYRAKRYKTTHVYYLPEEHYIGITKDITTRMSQHRGIGRHTEDMIVLCSFKRRIDAKFLEVQFHMRGYNGDLEI